MIAMFPTPQRFEGDVSRIVDMVPEWLPPVVTGGRVDIWTMQAILAIAKRIDEIEASIDEEEARRG